MIVEWFGGPKDGEQLDVPDGLASLVMNELIEMRWRAFVGDPDVRVPFVRYRVPIWDGHIIWAARIEVGP